MILRPCLHCRFVADCDIRRAKLAALKGSGITSASFRCVKRTEGLAPGTRVEVTIRFCELAGDHMERWLEQLPGVVIKHCHNGGKHPGKVLVWLDEPIADDAGRTKIHVHPDRLRPLDEPPVALCPECSSRTDRDNSEMFVCPACDPKEPEV